jgi:hypothetical protein
MVCAFVSKRRLGLPEWGLGSDPAWPVDVDRVLKYETARREEYHACNVHWCLVAYATGEYSMAAEVEDYLNMSSAPDPASIRKWAKIPYLPKSFEKRCLKVLSDSK